MVLFIVCWIKLHGRLKCLCPWTTVNYYATVFCAGVHSYFCRVGLRFQLLQNWRETFQPRPGRDLWMRSARQRFSICRRAGLHQFPNPALQLFTLLQRLSPEAWISDLCWLKWNLPLVCTRSAITHPSQLVMQSPKNSPFGKVVEGEYWPD